MSGRAARGAHEGTGTAGPRARRGGSGPIATDRRPFHFRVRARGETREIFGDARDDRTFRLELKRPRAQGPRFSSSTTFLGGMIRRRARER